MSVVGVGVGGRPFCKKCIRSLLLLGPVRIVPPPQGAEGHSRRLSVTQLSLWLAASAPGLACAVTGARQPSYVTDVAAVLRLPPLPAPRVTAAVRTVEAALQEMGMR